MVHFDEVREIAFTPAPPSDREHEPLISSFALIKIVYTFEPLSVGGARGQRFSGSDPCIQGIHGKWREKFEMGNVHLVVIPQPIGKGEK